MSDPLLFSSWSRFRSVKKDVVRTKLPACLYVRISEIECIHKQEVARKKKGKDITGTFSYLVDTSPEAPDE